MEPKLVSGYISAPPAQTLIEDKGKSKSSASGSLPIDPSSMNYDEPSPPLTGKRVSREIPSHAIDSTLATIQAASESEVELEASPTLTSSFLLQAMDRAPDEAREHMEKGTSYAEAKVEQKESSLVDKAAALLNRKRDELEVVYLKLGKLEKENERLKSYLSKAIIVAKKLAQSTNPETVALRQKVGPELIQKMRNLQSNIERTEQEIADYSSLGINLEVEESVAEQELQKLLQNQVSTSSSVSAELEHVVIYKHPENRFTQQDLQTFTDRSTSFLQRPSLQKTNTVLASKPIDELMSTLRPDGKKPNIKLVDGKIVRTSDAVSKKEASAAVEHIFNLIQKEIPPLKNLESILTYLQTNESTARAIQDKRQLRETLQGHLKKIRDENPLQFYRNQVVLLKQDSNLKLTSTKEGLVYVVPTSQLGLNFRKGSSAEAKNSIKIILKQMESSVESLPELSPEVSKKVIQDLEMLKGFLKVPLKWTSATINYHNLSEKVDATIDKMDKGVTARNEIAKEASKLKQQEKLTKESYVDSVLNISTTDPVEFMKLLRAYRNLMPTTEFMDRLAKAIGEPPSNIFSTDDDSKIQKQRQVFLLLQGWFADAESNQGEWYILKNHPLLDRLPNSNDVLKDLPWSDLKNAIRLKAAEAPSTPFKTAYIKDRNLNDFMLRPEFSDFLAFLENVENPQSTSKETLVENIAYQLTAKSKSTFSNLKISEFNNANWKNARKEIDSPMIAQLIRDSESITTWVTSTILSIQNENERAKALDYFIALAMKLRENGDYYSMISVFNGITRTPVIRLTGSIEAMDHQSKLDYLTLQRLADPTGNNATLKEEISGKPNSIPHIGAYLGDLFNLAEAKKEGNRNVLSQPFVNTFNSIWLIISNAKNHEVPVPKNPIDFDLNNLIVHAPVVNDAFEKDAYNMSKTLQPPPPKQK